MKSEEYAKFGFRSWNYEKDVLAGMPWSGTKLIYILTMLLGWVIMAALLSIGAPFWHDTLESLFGIKTLLRKQGNIKNVETEAGAGQPQT